MEVIFLPYLFLRLTFCKSSARTRRNVSGFHFQPHDEPRIVEAIMAATLPLTTNKPPTNSKIQARNFKHSLTDREGK